MAEDVVCDVLIVSTLLEILPVTAPNKKAICFTVGVSTLLEILPSYRRNQETVRRPVSTLLEILPLMLGGFPSF